MRARARLRRGAYIIPSLFTTGNLMCGYIAVIRSLQGDYEWAAVALFVAALLDRVDGWVARLTRTSSDFGVQLDSLADIISFGMAPALMIYLWSLSQLPKPWSLAPFLYLAAGATRLARFNIQTPVQDRRFFIGLPIPAAACVLASCVFYSPARIVDPVTSMLLASLVVVLAGLMVSRLRYRSFKEIDLRSRVPWVMVSAMAVVYFLVAASPQIIGIVLSFLYVLSGLWPRRLTAGRGEARPAAVGERHAGG
jgi:CDP-diacylglycerol---serine O-phosphatidyltransferase